LKKYPSAPDIDWDMINLITSKVFEVEDLFSR